MLQFLGANLHIDPLQVVQETTMATVHKAAATIKVVKKIINFILMNHHKEHI